MIQQNQNDIMLKQVLKLSENQEVDQIADVVQVELHFQLIKNILIQSLLDSLSDEKQKQVLSIINVNR